MKYRNKSCNICFFGKLDTDVTGGGYALVTIRDEDYLTTAPGVLMTSSDLIGKQSGQERKE